MLPLGFLIGLGVLALAEKLGIVLPGSGSVSRFSIWCLLLPLPAVLTVIAHGRVQGHFERGGAPGPGLRLLLRVLPGIGPCVYLAVLTEGTWLDLAESLSGSSETLRLLLLLLPMVLMELARIAAETRMQAGLDVVGQVSGIPTLRERSAIMALLAMPPVVFGVCLDLVAGNRWLEVFCRATWPGAIVGVVCISILLGVLMPLAFRWLMATSSCLPAQLAEDLRATAAALGFPPRALLSMETGQRMINAAMVGPLPWPRYLVLTDGLLSELDLLELRGVVAHEVGHARAGHPALLVVLFVALPLLLLHPLGLLGIENSGPAVIVAVVLVVAVAIALALRRVAHRFEHEADILSAQALGGAGPCIMALQRVGKLNQVEVHRSSWIHPSETRRIELLLRWQSDPLFRQRFDRAGQRLRRGIALACGVALVASLIAFWWSWPMERAVVAFYTGQVATARAQVQAIGTSVPAAQWEWWQRFVSEIDAAAQVSPVDQSWETLRPLLADRGWRRGLEVLRTGDAIAARPWFALALEDAGRSPVRRSVHLWCEALEAGDTGRAERLRAHLQSLDLPEELQQALKVSNG